MSFSDYSSTLTRRNAVKIGAAAAGALSASLSGPLTRPARAGKRTPQSGVGPIANQPSPLVGVQIGPHALFDEGFDHSLDLLQNEGGVNTLFISSHTYYGGKPKPHHFRADHGKPFPDESKRQLPYVWVKHHDRYFRKWRTPLRHAKVTTQHAFHDRDLISEIEKPARARGMNVYLRLYEGWGSERLESIPGWKDVESIDAYGNRVGIPCWANPAFRGWWMATIEDLLRTYPVIDGIQYGYERSGPLRDVLYGNTTPLCFCKYCKKRGRKAGLDVEGVRKAYIKLYEFIKALNAGQKPNAPAGVFVQTMRLLLQNPEVMMWEKLNHEARESLSANMYKLTKRLRPSVDFGYHYGDVPVRCPLERAQQDMSELSTYGDFLKQILYHDIGGPRMKRNAGKLQNGFLNALSVEEVLKLVYVFDGHDPAHEPGYDTLKEEGLSPKTVITETDRAVKAAAGRAKVYPGIGLDVPLKKKWGNRRWQTPREEIQEAVVGAFKVGASGVVASREYDEISIASFNAFRDGVTEGQKHKKADATPM